MPSSHPILLPLLFPPFTSALHLLSAIADLPSPDPLSLSTSSPGNPGTPGCVYLGTGSNWSGNTTYKCPDVGQNELPCIGNAPFQTSLGPDAGTVCVTFGGDRCQSETLVGAVRWPGNACMRGYGSFFCWKSERGVGSVGVRGVEGVETMEEGDCESSGGSSASSVEGTARTSVGGGQTSSSSGGSSGSQESKTGGGGGVTGGPGSSGSVTGPATNTAGGIGIGTSDGGTSQDAGLPTGSERPSQSGNKQPRSSGGATQGTFALTSAASPPSGPQPSSQSNSTPRSEVSNTAPESLAPTGIISTNLPGSSVG